MLQLEVLVGELFTVNGLAASAITGREITALDHELLDDAVEYRSLVGERLSRLAGTLLACAQGAEVVGRLGHNVVVELKRDASRIFAPNRNIEEDAGTARLDSLSGSHFCLGNLIASS